MSGALALLPDFALILLGATLRRGMHLGDHFWNGVEKLVYFVLFPALLFSSVAGTRIDWHAAGPLISVAGLTLLSALLLGFGGKLFAISSRTFASQFQCAFRYNSYIGLAVAGNLYGAEGIAAMAIIIGVMVPPANMAAVWMLARQGEQNVLHELARNPLILGTLAGLLVNLSGWSLPEFSLRALGRLADASIALGLLTVGAGLRLNALRVDGPKGIPLGTGGTAAAGTASYFLVVKLVAKPLIAWWLARHFGLPPLYADTVLIWAALPTASSAYILAQRMGGDGPSVAWLVSASTLLAMISMPLWLGLTTWHPAG